MVKSIYTAEYKVLLKSLVAARNSAGLTQQQLARKLRKPQSFVSKYETGERRLDVIEFLKITHIMGADPYRLLREVEGRSSQRKSTGEAG